MSTEEIGTSPEVVTADSTTATNVMVTDGNADSSPAQGSMDADEFDKHDAPEDTGNTGAEPTGAERRIKQLAAQRKSAEEARLRAEAEREYYKGLAEGRVGKPEAAPTRYEQPVAPQLPARPKLEDFETYDEYEASKDEWMISKARFEAKQDLERDRQEYLMREKAQNNYRKLQTLADKDVAFGEILRNPALFDTLPINTVMAEVITESAVPNEIIKWIHNNRSEAARISSLPPVMAARELVLLEAKITSKPAAEPPRRVSSAPEPIKTVSTTTQAEVNEDDLPLAEYIRRKNLAQFGRA